MSESYRKYRDQGICYICRRNPIYAPHVTCDGCAKEQREKQQARVAKARDEGKCIKDFKQPQAPGSVYCQDCLDRTRRLAHASTRDDEITQRPLRQWHSHRHSRTSSEDANQLSFDTPVTEENLWSPTA